MDQVKTTLETKKDQVSEAWDENVNKPAQKLADNITYAKDQTGDKINEKYYAGKQEVRRGAKNVKDAMND